MKKPYVLGILVAAIIVAIFWVARSRQSVTPFATHSVTVGMVTFPGYAPLYLAQEKKLFGDLDVKLVRIESIGDLRAAMSSGQIDMYAATYDIFQAVKDVVPPGVGFLAVDESHGADGVVVKGGINSLADLRGKTIGSEPGFPAYFILQHLLGQAGMTLKDVNFKDMASQDAGNAFVAKQLDAAGTYEPYLSISMQKRPGSKILFSSKDAPGLIVDFLFASDRLVTQEPQVLKQVADGWFKAVAYWENYPDESSGIMARAFGVSKQEMIDFKIGVSWKTLADNKQLFDRSQQQNAFTTFKQVGDILEANGGTNVRMSADNKLTDSILKLYP